MPIDDTALSDMITAMGRNARRAAQTLMSMDRRQQDRILEAMAHGIGEQRAAILEANAADMRAGEAAGLSAAMLDRLRLDDRRIDAMADGMRQVAALPNPLGRVLRRWRRPNGLRIAKVRVPIGVIAIIYESRPNVTADAAALCFKTANAVILRGGHEALRSAGAIVAAMTAAGRPQGLPEHAIQLIATPDRAAVQALVELEDLVNLVIPRGGEALIRAVNRMARVPVIKHYKGVCHVFVDAGADLPAALDIVENAKCQRPGVCNAMETLLVHAAVAGDFLPAMAARLTARGVELRGDAGARDIVPEMRPAAESDWPAEYLDLILAVRVVPDVQSAIEHINRHGSGHSDAILTRSRKSARLFKQNVDSAAVYVNASTRFTDGGEFGMGAEIGISTDKLHARGPMGLEELTTYKYLVEGQGHVRT